MANGCLHQFYLSRNQLLIPVAACFVLLGLSAGPALAASGNQEQLRDSIEAKISERHPNETHKWWRKLGPEAPAVMMKMYAEKQGIYERIRIVEALGWFKKAEVTAFLKKVYETETNAVLKKAALRSIAVAEGGGQRKFLEKALGQANRHEKVRIAKILDASGEAASVQMVDKMMTEEKDEAVVTSIRDQRAKLRKIKESP